jgi:hypothetical protein
MVADQLLIEDVMDRFITHVYPYREQIMQEREEYFLSDPQIFNTVKDQSRVLSLKRLWTDPKFTAEDKKGIEEWSAEGLQFVASAGDAAAAVQQAGRLQRVGR